MPAFAGMVNSGSSGISLATPDTVQGDLLAVKHPQKEGDVFVFVISPASNISASGLYSLLQTQGWSLVRPHPVARHREPVAVEGMAERTTPLSLATCAKRLATA